MGGLANHGRTLYKLHRTRKPRWHLYRNLLTQLAEHERINTTITKCRAIQPLAEKVLALARRYNLTTKVRYKAKIETILTTKLAREKVIKEVGPRLKTHTFQTTRIVKTHCRKGDNAQMAYIEYIGNELDQFEQREIKEENESSKKLDEGSFEKKILKEEKAFFQGKLKEAEEQLNSLSLSGLDQNEKVIAKRIKQAQVDFFKQKVQKSDHELYIRQKNKYDLIKFPLYS